MVCGYSNCSLPYNPLYIRCDDTEPVARERPTEPQRHLASNPENMRRLVDSDDVLVKRTDRGVYFTPSNRFKVLLHCILYWRSSPMTELRRLF